MTMHRRDLLFGAALVAVAGSASLARAAEPAQMPINHDHGAAPEGPFEIVARFDGPGPSGIAVTGGRVFVGFPRHAVNHRGATLAELKNGRLLPYPDAATAMPSDRPPATRLMSIHGMTTDAKGRLWAIDDGKLAGEPLAPGAAKGSASTRPPTASSPVSC